MRKKEEIYSTVFGYHLCVLTVHSHNWALGNLKTLFKKSSHWALRNLKTLFKKSSHWALGNLKTLFKKSSHWALGNLKTLVKKSSHWALGNLMTCFKKSSHWALENLKTLEILYEFYVGKKQIFWSLALKSINWVMGLCRQLMSFMFIGLLKIITFLFFNFMGPTALFLLIWISRCVSFCLDRIWGHVKKEDSLILSFLHITG